MIPRHDDTCYDLVPNELWALVAPLLPAPPRPPYGGRRRSIPDRACFAAIMYMARTSRSWQAWEQAKSGL
jgi:transposase